jgi:hypothetical protein
VNPSLLSVILSAIMTAAIADFTLPDPLEPAAGRRITSPAEWQKEGRPITLELFREHIYGHTPALDPANLSFELLEINPRAMNGMATLKRISIHFRGPGGSGSFPVSIFIPNDTPRPVPGFIFIANRERELIDPTREIQSPFWPAELIVSRGFVAAAFHNGDVAPDDRNDGFRSGVFGALDEPGKDRSPNAWGTIAAWAWGASRVMDYFTTDPEIDEHRTAVIGHSRAGKAALWAGAEDERFALTISNNSGCSGAALARRRLGETVGVINRNFPHWFARNYQEFNDREDALPVDQHQLIALLAPRLVYLASASEDGWADPEGEFLAALEAEPVYRLFGLKGLGSSDFPKPDTQIHSGHIGYHLRPGGHDLTPYDWLRFLNFAKSHWEE